MAAILHDDGNNDAGSHGEQSDEARREAFIARFEREDTAAVDEEDGITHDDDDEGDTQDDSDAGTERGDSEDTDEDTDGHRDGAADESDEVSEEDDDADTLDDEESDDDDADANDDDADEDGEAGEADDEDAVSPETKAALERHGATLTLDEIPEKYRGIVETKLKRIDQAFTRSAQELTAWRKQEREIRAEETFRAQNPELVIVEMLQKGDASLLDKVNKYLDRMNPDADGNDADTAKDAKTLFEEKAQMSRRRAADALEATEKEQAAIFQRADAVESTAKAFAKKMGVPYGQTLETLLESAILRKPEKERMNGLTETEVKAIVKTFADEHGRSVRAHRREESKRVVQGRTERRNAPKPTVRTKGGTSSPGARPPAKMKVDYNNEESRRAGMLKAAVRILPGAK